MRDQFERARDQRIQWEQHQRLLNVARLAGSLAAEAIDAGNEALVEAANEIGDLALNQPGGGVENAS